MSKKITFKQVIAFQRMAKRAWHACAGSLGFVENSDSEFKAWRRAERVAAIGKEDLMDVDRIGEFEALMLYFAMTVGDAGDIEYWTQCVERRYRHLIDKHLVKLSNAAGHLFDWRYARGIMAHMQLPESMQDIPAEKLFPVFQALDTHLRRMKKRGHEMPHAPEQHGHAEAA